VQGRNFLTALLPQLDTQVLGNAVNANGTFIRNLMTQIGNDPAAVASLVAPMNTWHATVTDNFTVRLLRDGLDPAVVAGLLNNNGTFISNLLAVLDPGVVATAVNQNGAFLEEMLTYTDTSDIADIVNNSPGVQNMVNQLVGLLDGGVIADAMSAHPEMTEALLAPAPAGIDTDILVPILSHSETRELLAGVLANMSATGTRTLLVNTGNMIRGLMSGLNPDVIVNAIAGPVAHAGTNPRTGTGWAPNQNVLRNVMIYGAMKIVDIEYHDPAVPQWLIDMVQGLIGGIAINANVQFHDARRNSTIDQPLPAW
jgi:hypothetical protein